MSAGRCPHSSPVSRRGAPELMAPPARRRMSKTSCSRRCACACARRSLAPNERCAASACGRARSRSAQRASRRRRRTPVSDPRRALERAGLSAKKSFGQNFLVAPHVVDSIAAACVPDAEIGKALVVELGAGTGALTRALVGRAAHVVAVERDRDLVPVLNDELRDEIATGKLTIVEGDAQAVVAKQVAGDGHPLVLCG